MTKDNNHDNEKRLDESRQYWNDVAASFDNEPDHGLHNPVVLGAWTQLLRTWLPPNNVTILDVGCGTGSLSVVLAGLGHEVTGIDLSPVMISLAKAKAVASKYPVTFQVMDAAFLELPPRQYDAIVCRHLLWALPEPSQVLQRWVRLLKRGGRLVLIEGYWNTGGGLHAEQIVEALPSSLTKVEIQNLSNQPNLWGGVVADERYMLVADLHT